MDDLIQYVLISPCLGHEIILKANTYSEAVAIVQYDYANCGKIKLERRTYRLLTVDPYLIDTDYK